MFGLKNEKLLLLIHVVVLFISSRQTDEQTDKWIDLLQMYRSSSIIYICMQVLFAHIVKLVYGDCSKIIKDDYFDFLPTCETISLV